MNYQEIINKYYPEGTRLRDIYMRHALDVAAMAEELRAKYHPDLDPAEVRAASMTHDIGIFLTDAPGIECHGSAPYIQHGPLGADLLRREGAPEWMARVAERHTGVGIGNLVPETMLEKLVCYADKFYSKSGDMKRKSLDRVEASMARYGAQNLEAFHRLRLQVLQIL
ncbi:MAG: HDIG domain-containing protein [Bacteroides sp.]|nr:HDIG domain-containing protein [Bacteroides sp.]MCM1379064.1 HDIG domain-containing protein [Bacteroides sp.]MCM1445762.1 HDIG domain-containing protein [Prevotella sp.]